MRGRYEDERRIGVLMGLGTQCQATTGEGCDHDINHVTHMTTKGGIRKGSRSFRMPAFNGDISKHGVWESMSRLQTCVSCQQNPGTTHEVFRNGATWKVQRCRDWNTTRRDSLFDLDFFARVCTIGVECGASGGASAGIKTRGGG